MINQDLPASDLSFNTSGRILDNSELSPTSEEVNVLSPFNDDREVVLSTSNSGFNETYQISDNLQGAEVLTSIPTYNTHHRSEGLVESHSQKTPLICTIDNIRCSWKFKKSPRIKSEFNKYFPDIRLVLAYSLRGGGVAIHFQTEGDLNRVLTFSWPDSAFENSGHQLLVRRVDDNPRLILKNVDPSISTDEIEFVLTKFTKCSIKAHRFKHKDSNKPLPVVKISCPSLCVRMSQIF